MSGGDLVLMYHGVEDLAPHGEAHYTVAEEIFREHMEILAEGQNVAPLADLFIERANWRRIVITFDDGEKSVITRAWPLMKEQGLVGAVFMTTRFVGTPGYLDAEDLRRLRDAGWTIGAHGASHRLLSDLSAAQIEEELRESRDTLASILGHPPRHMSLPGGRGNHLVNQLARCAGFESICTSQIARNQSPLDPFSICRLMIFAEWNVCTFRRLVDDEFPYLFILQVRQELLDAAKQILGNQHYEQARAVAKKLIDKTRKIRG